MHSRSTSSIIQIIILFSITWNATVTFGHPAPEPIESGGALVTRASACSDPTDLCSTCGGEDSKNKGRCQKNPPGNDDPCACVPDERTVTKTISGHNVTATYRATKFPELATISGTTTVTKTITENGKETEAALVVAGAGAAGGAVAGIAWWLAGTSGDAAAGEAMPESTTEEPEEQLKCDSDKPSCPDCGGDDGSGSCKSGDKIGCPCEKSKCSDGVKPPQCSDPACKGDKSICTQGDAKGCPCCPDFRYLCSDKDCNGKKNSCEADISKSCLCAAEIALQSNDPIYFPNYDHKVLDHWRNDLFATRYGGDWKNVPFSEYIDKPPALSDIQCSAALNQGWDPGAIKSLAKTFCKDFNPNKDKYQRFSNVDTQICSSEVHLQFKRGRDGSCSKSCEDTFSDMITRCQMNSHMLNKGATFGPPCGEFSIGGTLPDHSGITNQVCFKNGTPPPENGLSQTFDRDKAMAVIDYTCKKKFQPRGICSFGETSKGLMAQSKDPLVFAYAHFHDYADGCPGLTRQFTITWNTIDYMKQDGFKDQCTKALTVAMDQCTKDGDCGQTFGGSVRLDCVDYQIFLAKAGSPPTLAKGLCT